MDYMECKALSEVVEAHDYAIAALFALRSRLVVSGVETRSIRSSMRAYLYGLFVGKLRAQQRYDRAYDLCLAGSFTNQWSGQAMPIPTALVRAAT